MWVAAELGARLYVVHPDMQRRPGGWNQTVADSLERAFEELSELQDEIGLPIAVENMPFPKHSHFIAPGDLDLKGLGLVLDTGHAAMTGTLSDWLNDPLVDLRHVHLNDNQGHPGGDHHDALGTGVVDIKPILDAARAAGASIVLEHKDEASVIASLHHLRMRGLLVRDLE
jgi:sugar phosphate isomerase/epimerase